MTFTESSGYMSTRQSAIAACSIQLMNHAQLCEPCCDHRYTATASIAASYCFVSCQLYQRTSIIFTVIQAAVITSAVSLRPQILLLANLLQQLASPC
jgi:hypothetical protein